MLLIMYRYASRPDGNPLRLPRQTGSMLNEMRSRKTIKCVASSSLASRLRQGIRPTCARLPDRKAPMLGSVASRVRTASLERARSAGHVREREKHAIVKHFQYAAPFAVSRYSLSVVCSLQTAPRSFVASKWLVNRLANARLMTRRRSAQEMALLTSRTSRATCRRCET